MVTNTQTNSKASTKKSEEYEVGRVFAVLVGVWAIFVVLLMFTSVANAVAIIISGKADAQAVGQAGTTIVVSILLESFFVYAAFAIYRKNRHTLGIVYALAAIFALGILFRGLIPKEIVYYLAAAIPVIIYFKKRKHLFKKAKDGIALSNG